MVVPLLVPGTLELEAGMSLVTGPAEPFRRAEARPGPAHLDLSSLQLPDGDQNWGIRITRPVIGVESLYRHCRTSSPI